MKQRMTDEEEKIYQQRQALEKEFRIMLARQKAEREGLLAKFKVLQAECIHPKKFRDYYSTQGEDNSQCLLCGAKEPFFR